MALWLCRAQPPGDVMLKGMQKSRATFDRLIGRGDKPYFAVLEGKANLREAFFAWVEMADPELARLTNTNPNKPHGKKGRR
jgi:hypothetical protein